MLRQEPTDCRGVRALGLVLVAMLATVGPAGAQTTEERIRALEEEWRLASIHSDTATFRRLMAPDHHGIRTDGLVTSRDDRLRAFGSGDVRTQSLEYSDVHIRVDGNVAVVTGLATRKDSVGGGRSPRDFQYRFTRVWQRREARWQVIEFQSTTVDLGHVGGLPRSAAASEEDRPRDPLAEERAIRALLARYDSSSSQHAPEWRLPLFAEDADITNVVGRTRHGRAGAAAFRSDSLYQRMYAEAVERIDSTSIHFLSPTLAAVDAYWTMTGARHPDGTSWPERRGLMSLLLSKRTGTWLIQIFHNAEFPAR